MLSPILTRYGNLIHKDFVSSFFLFQPFFIVFNNFMMELRVNEELTIPGDNHFDLVNLKHKCLLGQFFLLGGKEI